MFAGTLMAVNDLTAAFMKSSNDRYLMIYYLSSSLTIIPFPIELSLESRVGLEMNVKIRDTHRSRQRATRTPNEGYPKDPRERFRIGQKRREILVPPRAFRRRPE